MVCWKNTLLAKLAFATCLVLAASTGCSDGRPDRVNVSGLVTIDGNPLKLGNVKFVPEGARPSSGKIGSDGRFILGCYEDDDGIVTGLHRVQVSSYEVAGEKVTRYVPMKYANYTSSGIAYEITAPTDALVIELFSDGRPAIVHDDAAK
jgi:hypothetical protein